MNGLILFFQSLILGVVEGLTEFLPVSSTGHLIIAEHILGFDRALDKTFVDAFTYIIQLGAILAIIILYRRRLIRTFVNFSPKKVGFEKSGLRFWALIVVACIPGTIAELTLGDMVEDKLFNYWGVSIFLILGAIIMIVTDNLLFKNNKKRIADITFKMAIGIGIAQCFAIFPGMSRSASTIIGGIILGLSNVAAAEFSFFLAIPVMLGMTFLKLIKLHGLQITGLEIGCLIIGFVASFFIAVFVVKGFLGFLKKHSLFPFAIYRIIFAGIVILAGFLHLF